MVAAVPDVYRIAAQAVLKKFGTRGGFCVEELVDEGWLHLHLYPLRNNEGGAAFTALFKHLSRYVLEARHGMSFYWQKHHPETRVQRLLGEPVVYSCAPVESMALDLLTGRERWLIVEHLYLDRPLKEIADDYGISESACKGRYHRAILRLREMWGGEPA